MGSSARARGSGAGRLVQQRPWGCGAEVEAGEATGNHPGRSSQEGSHLGRAWTLALRLHFGYDGVGSPSTCPQHAVRGSRV